jgi:hypothetical protein
MASERSNSDGIGDRLPDPFVRPRKPEPDTVPSVTATLSGLLGDSDRPGRRRLYLTTRLDYYVEFATTDVIAVEDVAPDQPPFPGLDATRVTLRSDARIEYISSRLAGAADEFELDVRGTAGPPRSQFPDARAAAGSNGFCNPQFGRSLGGSCVGTCDTRFFGTCEESTCEGTCFEVTCWGTCVGATCRGTCGEATCGRVTCFGTCGGETCRGTCDASCVGTCGEATCNGPTCVGTCGEGTCRGATCDRQTCATCRGETCVGTCFGTCGEATCGSTCGQATCEGQTCRGTCRGATCAGTCGTATCWGTCDATCPGDACGETRFFVCQPTLPAERCFLSQQC